MLDFLPKSCKVVNYFVKLDREIFGLELRLANIVLLILMGREIFLFLFCIGILLGSMKIVLKFSFLFEMLGVADQGYGVEGVRGI